MFLGVLIPTAAAVFIIYFIVPNVWHGLVLVLCWYPKASTLVIVIAGPWSNETPDAVCDCCFAIAMAIVVAGLHSSCSIIINNINTSYIKTIANTMPFPSLHQPDFLPLSASATCPFPLCIAFMYFTSSSFARTSMLMKGCCLLIRDLTWSCCLLTWSTFPFCNCNYRSAFCCCVVVCVSRLLLSLPLSDCVLVVVATVVFGLQYLERRTCWQCSW